MKINGNDSGAHAAKKPSREKTAPKKQKTARRRMGRAARMATVIVCCVLALACAVAAWYMLWEKPPERPTTGLNTLPPRHGKARGHGRAQRHARAHGGPQRRRARQSQ